MDQRKQIQWNVAGLWNNSIGKASDGQIATLINAAIMVENGSYAVLVAPQTEFKRV